MSRVSDSFTGAEAAEGASETEVSARHQESGILSKERTTWTPLPRGHAPRSRPRLTLVYQDPPGQPPPPHQHTATQETTSHNDTLIQRAPFRRVFNPRHRSGPTAAVPRGVQPGPDQGTHQYRYGLSLSTLMLLRGSCLNQVLMVNPFWYGHLAMGGRAMA